MALTGRVLMYARCLSYGVRERRYVVLRICMEERIIEKQQQ